MLRLENDWVWDSWPIDDSDGRHHLFFLKAPRSLGDPHLRHVNARVGHAVSDDYRNWTLLPDALAPAAEPAWDDGAIWTGSIVQGPTGEYHFFYTACSRGDDYLVQRIGRAVSSDLVTWTRTSDEPAIEADARWYELYDGSSWHDQAWRDPWVFADPDGEGWHMLITARKNHGDRFSRGVVGHAWSADLVNWEPRPPLMSPEGFGQLEVMQLLPAGTIGPSPYVLFSCEVGELDPAVHPQGQVGGMWVVEGTGALGPWNASPAVHVDESVYAAHVVIDVDGTPALIGFERGDSAAFDGVILDPIPMTVIPTQTKT